MITAPEFSTARQSICGIQIAELTEKHGTPLYVYDRTSIDQRITDLAAFDRIRFAQKACSILRSWTASAAAEWSLTR